MASNIDATKPTSGTATTQSVRDNFLAAKNEIEALQTAVAEAGITLAATPPTLPHASKLWWNTETGDLYVQYGGAWVGAVTTKNGKDGAPGQNGLLTLAEIHAALLVF